MMLIPVIATLIADPRTPDFPERIVARVTVMEFSPLVKQRRDSNFIEVRVIHREA
jgi:hypothetical protein